MEKGMGRRLRTVKLGATSPLPIQNYKGLSGALLCLCTANSLCFIFLLDAFSVELTTKQNKIKWSPTY